MTSAADHLHKAVSHHAKANDAVRAMAAKAAAEVETQLLRDRELTSARLMGEQKEA